KYFWKFMMVKAQQMDLYMKGEGPPLTTNVLPGYPHNYDPHGWNPFEEDALRLREIFNKIKDYGSLRFIGHFFISPVGHNLVLSSQQEIIAYISSPTGIENMHYDTNGKGVQIRLTDLPFPNGEYTAIIFDPKSGITGSRKIK